MYCKITLTPSCLEDATLTRIKRGIEVPADFEGPEFIDIKDIVWGALFIHVTTYGYEVYSYPYTSIARIKTKGF